MRIPYALRVALSVTVGIGVGIGLTFLLEQDILAALLGSLAALAIAGAEEVKGSVVVAFASGAAIGLFLVARGERLFSAQWVPAGPLETAVHLLVGAIVCGLVGALYSFVIAKLKPLFDQGRAPYF